MGRRENMDPRNLLPSRADPKARSTRKELEKASNYSFAEPLALGLAAVGLIWNLEKQVQKCEERKQKQKRDEDRGSEYDSSRGRAKSSRRPPPTGSSSRSTMRGDERRARSRYDGDGEYYTSQPSKAAREYDPYYYPHSSRGRYQRGDYDGDHYYYDDHRNPARRERHFVEDTDGVPRSERRKSRAGDEDIRTMHPDGGAPSGTGVPSSTTATVNGTNHSDSQHLGEQYDDGFEKKRFDGVPTEPAVDDSKFERRGRRSRRDSF